MKATTYGRYSKEFREEAVKFVIEKGKSVNQVAEELSLPKSTLTGWLKSYKSGNLDKIHSAHPSLSAVEEELARVKRELAYIKMERDILKKAAAYFAKESLTSTR